MDPRGVPTLAAGLLPEVPAQVQGLWQRTLLAVPASAHSPQTAAPTDLLRDTSTRVYWLQTPLWHADIRVPAQRPDFSGVASLAECSEAQLRWLLGQQGFAGVTTVEGDICRWHRRIDLAASLSADIGRLVFDDEGLQEWGVESDYFERWVPVGGAGLAGTGEAIGAGWGAEQAAGSPPARCLLRSGRWAMQLRDRPLDGATTRSVRRAAAASEPVDRTLLEAAADLEISLAEWQGDGDGWRVVLSTWPWREGQPLALPAETQDPPLPWHRLLTE